MHGDSSQALEKQVADLKQHVAAHEARVSHCELQVPRGNLTCALCL